MSSEMVVIESSKANKLYLTRITDGKEFHTVLTKYVAIPGHRRTERIPDSIVYCLRLHL